MAKKLQNKAQLYNINFRQVPATYPRNKLFLTWQSPAQPTKPTNTEASYHNTLPVFTSAAAAAGREPGWSFWHENMTRAKVAGTILYHSHPLLRAREKKTAQPPYSNTHFASRGWKTVRICSSRPTTTTTANHKPH